jgi:spore coat protein SA
MKTVYLAMPPYLPVPAVKGGAVETLAEMYIDENEKHRQFNLVCFSTDCPEAREKAKKYRYTEFIFINNHTKGSRVKYHVSRLIHKMTQCRPYFLDDYHGSIYRYVKKRKPDLLIVEGGSCINEYKKISKCIGASRMALHVHLNALNSNSAHKVFNHLISVSEFTQNEWKKKAVFADCHVLKNATIIGRYNPENFRNTSAIRKKLGYKENDFVVIFCGRLTEVKGIRELIQAVLAIENNNVKLLVLGSANFSGASMTDYQKEIIELADRTDRVKFTGFIHNSEIPVYYNLAQVVAVPSVYEDPAPLVAIEGMAAGKAMIVTNSGGMPEYVPSEGRILVRKEKEYIIDDLKNAIETLYRDDSLREAMGKKNLNASKMYSESTYYTRFSEIIEDICTIN